MPDTTSAEVIADSVSPSGKRLTSIQVCFPRFILAEVNTHRVFSRNYRSSRAVPVAKLIEEVRTNPFEPAQWMKNMAGMQAGEPMDEKEAELCRTAWRLGAKNAADLADTLRGLNLHKQWANRGLEPYLYVHGIISSTEWSNFFALRCHKDAQPEFRLLAEHMRFALERSEPVTLRAGEWHLPYTSEQRDGFSDVRSIKLSVARCARVSYYTHDKKVPTIEDDLKLYERLAGSVPKHLSPCEHQATPDRWIYDHQGWTQPERPELHGNFVGWIQYRKTLEGENQ